MNPKFVPFVKELLELEEKHGVRVTYTGNDCSCDLIVEDVENISDDQYMWEVIEEIKKEQVE